MGVCRRIFKNYQPTELTICVTIYSEPRSPPKFEKWNISKPGYPPKIISCSRGTTDDVNRENRSKRKVVKRRKKSEVDGKSKEEIEKKELEFLSDQPLLHSDSATLISDDVGSMISEIGLPECSVREKRDSVCEDVANPRDRHISVTSLDSVAELGGMTSHAEDSDGMRRIVNQEDFSVDYESKEDRIHEENEENEATKQMKNKKKFDLLSNGDVEIPTIQLMMNDNGTPKKKVNGRKKKKSITPDSAPRYRDFTETSINMYIEMNKQNIGEFVWDQQCTRIDAIVAPIVELDRLTTPEIPVEIEIFD